MDKHALLKVLMQLNPMMTWVHQKRQEQRPIIIMVKAPQDTMTAMVHRVMTDTIHHTDF